MDIEQKLQNRGEDTFPLRAPAHTGTPSGTPTGTRAAGDVGPYHAPRPVRTHGRARRPRRAAHTRTPSGTHTGTRAAGDVGPYHAPRPVRTHGRARRPRRAAHTGTPSGTPTGTRAAGTSAPTMPHVLSAPMVGADVPGAPRTRGHHRGRTRARGPTSPAARPRRGSFARRLPFVQHATSSRAAAT